MKIYLDNCLPRKLKFHLNAEYTIDHASDREWGGLENGTLLRTVEPEYDVFITVDRAQRTQQQEQKKGYEQYELSFIVLRVFSNSLPAILPFAPAINLALATIEAGEPGQVHYLGEPRLLMKQ